MPLLPASEAPRFELPGAVITGLAARSRGAAEVTTYRVRLDPGSAMPLHRHDHEEVFTVVAAHKPADIIAAVPVGTLFITPDGEESVADWAK